MEEASNPASAPPAAAPREPGAFVGPAAAAALAWISLAIVQTAVDLAKLGAARGLHVVLGAAELALAGALSAGAALAYARVAPSAAPARGMFSPARVRAAAALAVAGALVGALFLREDASGIAGTSGVARALVGAAVGLSVPVVAIGAGALAAVLPPVPAALGVVVAVANNLALERAYFGLHLFAAWIAALLVGASIGRVPARRLPAVGRAGWAALAVIGLAGLVAPVPGAVQLEMYGTPGDAIAPWLARARGGGHGAARVDSPWFRDRAGLPDVPPTSPPLFAKPPVVVFFTVDAFRWDLVDSDTYKEQLPVLHRLRDEGAYFREARSPSPTTVTSISTIFTGLFYSQLYWTEQTGGGHQKLFPWQDDTSRVEGLLNAREVPTTLVVSGTGFADKYGLTPGFGESIGKGSPVGIPAAQITAAVVKRLEKPGEGPLFVYSHYFEPHAPYDRGGKEGTEFERYVKEVQIVDAELDKLLAAVERLGMKDRFVLVVTADHGEAFGEHGTKEHGTTLYDELIRVPLLVHGAGVTAKRVDTRVSTVDLGPTILDLFGAPTPAKFLGQSLVPLLRGEAPKLERPVVAESGRSMRSMYFDDDTVLIEDRRLHTTELFDLAKDPGELKNLWSADDAKAQQKLDRLHAFFEAHELHRPGYELPYRP